MSIPKLGGKMTTQQIETKYLELGWKRLLEFPWIEVDGRSGQILKKEYRFDSRTMQCSNRRCSRHGLTFVRLVPHGVVWTCGVCRRTMGPMAWEDGELTNGPVGKPVSLVEAWDTIQRSGQKPPIGIDPISGTGNLIIV